MGTQSKTKANQTGVAKKPRVVLGGTRSNGKGASPSTRSIAKAFTKARAGKGEAKGKVQGNTKSKAKGEGEIETVAQENVAEPSYYPKAMLGFCAEHLDSLEMDILKRLVRLYRKDTAGDVKKLLHVLGYYFPKDRTTEEVFDLVKDWTEVCMSHDHYDHAMNWELYWTTRIPYIAEKFIRAICLQSQDKLDLIKHELKELGSFM